MKQMYEGTIDWISELREGENINGPYRIIDAVLAEDAAACGDTYPNRYYFQARGTVADKLLELKALPFEKRRQHFAALLQFGVKQYSGKDGKTYAKPEIVCTQLNEPEAERGARC